MKGRIACKFCGETSREHHITDADSVENMAGLYLTHLIESHWPELVDARNQRVMQPMNERTLSAWKRL
jgi:hypothetical protein